MGNLICFTTANVDLQLHFFQRLWASQGKLSFCLKPVLASRKLDVEAWFRMNIQEVMLSKAIYDRVLWENDAYAVTPAKASFMDGWLLVWPKVRSTNAEILVGKGAGFSQLSILHGIFSEKTLANSLWFEHGPSGFGQAVGCGVDYAHIHVLLEPKFDVTEFHRAVRKLSNTTWNAREQANLRHSEHEAYHIYGTGNYFWFARKTEKFGSQFFRRVLASMDDEVDSWDYKAENPVDCSSTTVNFVSVRHRTIFRGATLVAE